MAPVSLAQCFPPSIAARVPQTGQVECIHQWKADTLLVVSELNCEPCSRLLYRMKKERSRKRAVTVLWLEPNEKNCIEASLKVSGFAKSLCSTAQNVKEEWGLNSTPTVFWLEGQIQREQKGLLDAQESLPWNIH